MIPNYIKIAVRNLIKSKAYSFINIAGLAIGMSCSILILLWVQDELSFNKFHKDADQIYRVAETQYYAGGEEFKIYNTPNPLAAALKEENPEVMYSARYAQWFGEMLVQQGDKRFYEIVQAADPSFFKIFTFPIIKGDKETFFDKPHSVLLTEKAAEKYFGKEDPIGKTLNLNNQYEFMVTGVLADMPANSDIQFEILVPYEFGREVSPEFFDNWFYNNYHTFVKLNAGIDAEKFSAKIKNRIKQEGEDTSTEIFLFPMTKTHLYSLNGENQPIAKVKLFTVIAIVILLIACINFMNLATARSAKRSKEVGLRKTLGAQRLQLIQQFFSESIILTLISLVLAVILVELLLPGFNQLSGKELSVNYFSNGFLLIILGITVLTGIAAGSYPALFLSSFNPIAVLKENINTGSKGAALRKGLVIFQFALSVILLISTFIVYSQLDYMKNMELGMNKENILYIPVKGDIGAQYYTFKNELLRNRNVSAVSVSSNKPAMMYSNGGGWEWEGKNPNDDVLVTFVSADPDYADVFNLKLAEGRFFRSDNPSDSVDGCVINEAFANLMGDGPKTGKILTRGEGVSLRILGVLKDYHYNSVKDKIAPMIMFPTRNNPSFLFAKNFIFIKIKGNDISGTMDYINRTYSAFNPAYPFNYFFLDQDFDKLFKSEERMGKLFNYFAVLAIFISCLGLFGLASFMAEQKQKEIGIRKVLGANTLQTTFLLSKSFVYLVVLANIIAWPVAYYFMSSWLEDYPNRISISPWIFLLSGLTALLIAFLTVSYQAIKASLMNPVKSLKYE
ncbi:MAG TPA: ABC transporter permease [Ignavibacteriales bacterium]|nr:ABC transporter permease [Ignavibacteriales bacterium]